MKPSSTANSEAISVLVCAFNRHEYIDKVLDSIAQQTLQPREIVIVDDGSSPPIKDPGRENVRLIRLDQNKGLANARNVGIEAALYPFIALLDTDDLWRPRKLEKQMNLMRQADQNVFGILTAFERHGRKVRAGTVRTPQVENWYHFFLMGIRCGPGSTLLMRRDAALASAKFDISLKRYEDWDWLINVTRSGAYSFLTIDEPLADVELSGRPNPSYSQAALERIASVHGPKMQTPTERRLFRAALSLEQAAVARWSGNYGAFTLNALKALEAPEIIKRELGLTFNRS